VVPPCVYPLSSHNVTPTKSSKCLLCLSFFYSIDMIELLLPCGFNTLEYSWMKATIGIFTLVDYSMAKKCQQNYKAHGDLSWFRPLLRGNSPTSSGLILNMNRCYKGVSRELEKFAW
jgi:hypothetical protein